MKRLLALLFLSSCTAVAPLASNTPPPDVTESPPQATYTPRPTYTPLPTATEYPTPTVKVSQQYWPHIHPIATMRPDGVAEVSVVEYQCYERNFYGIADGHNFWIHEDMAGYEACIASGGQ